MSSRFATKDQVEFALKLGAIESESQGRQMTKKTISRLIESAKQSHYQELCRIYNELDAELQRSGDILDLAGKATTLKKQGYSVWYCGPCPECGVAQIARKTGASKQYRMSHQDVVSTLATLSDSGIANFIQKGNKSYWSLVPDND